MPPGKLNSYGKKSLVPFAMATIVQTALFYGAVGTLGVVTRVVRVVRGKNRSPLTL